MSKPTVGVLKIFYSLTWEGAALRCTRGKFIKLYLTFGALHCM